MCKCAVRAALRETRRLGALFSFASSDKAISRANPPQQWTGRRLDSARHRRMVEEGLRCTLHTPGDARGLIAVWWGKLIGGTGAEDGQTLWHHKALLSKIWRFDYLIPRLGVHIHWTTTWLMLSGTFNTLYICPNTVVLLLLNENRNKVDEVSKYLAWHLLSNLKALWNLISVHPNILKPIVLEETVILIRLNEAFVLHIGINIFWFAQKHLLELIFNLHPCISATKVFYILS